MKVTIKGILKESEDNKQRYYTKLSKVLRPPYFRDLMTLNVPEEEWKDVLDIFYGEKIRYGYNLIGGEFQGGYISDNKFNILYNEDTDGSYYIRKFDKDGNVIYTYDSKRNN